ncbi:MAG: substrate-binding domain-containing protein [Candidatus Eisenbacteria bacterium]
MLVRASVPSPIFGKEIDTIPVPSLDLRRFVVAVIGQGRRTALRGFVPALALACSCSPRSAPDLVEDSLTSGRIRVMCAPEAKELIAREVAAFQALYPQAQIELTTGSSREAKAALFAARTDLAVITTELAPEERAAAVRGRLELEGYRFARDAVVLVANGANPVENVALDRLRQVYGGDLVDWADLGGERQPIEVVVQEPPSDVTEFVVAEILDGVPVKVRAIHAKSDSDVVAEVRRNPRALGYVTLAARTQGLRVLRVAPLTGLPYWKPDLEAVHRDEYPLTRFFSLYIRNDGPRLPNGFITFVTSQEGQALVHQHGLVPTAVPLRFVRRSPMLGGH